MDALLDLIAAWAQWSVSSSSGSPARSETSLARPEPSHRAPAGRASPPTPSWPPEPSLGTLAADLPSISGVCPEDGAELVPAPSPYDEVGICPQCEGCFVPKALFAAIEASPDQVEDLALPPAPVAKDPVRYRRCPQCAETMARRNYARVSGIIVDQCRTHGTWFDAGELHAVVRFIRSGGGERKAAFEAREAEYMKRQRARLKALSRAPFTRGVVPDPDFSDPDVF